MKMKRSIKITIVFLLFLLLQSFVTVCSMKLSAEPVKTSESTFIFTEEESYGVEYKVATKKDAYHAQEQAIKAEEEIYIVEFISDEVIEGMKLMNSEAATFTYKNVEVYFYGGITCFIIHK